MNKEKLSSLVVKAQEGNNQALNDLFTETYNDVYYFALKTVKDETLAADITQETFVTIFKNINSLSDPVAYPAWSRQITYRHCLQYIKKQNRETTVEENEDGSTIFDTIQEDREDFIPDKNLDKEDFKRTILEIVDSLPEEQRAAVILYYYDELTVNQIAEIQGVTSGTVKSRLNYARKAIKSSVENYENKNHIKLHSVGILPLLLWLFRTDANACSMSMPTVQTVASSVSVATGKTISASKLVLTGSKFLGALWQKIVAGVLIISVATGATIAVTNIINKPDTQISQDDEQLKETQKPEKENIKIKPPKRVPCWSGLGNADGIPSISDENQFILILEQRNEGYLKGELIIFACEDSSRKKLFSIDIEGTGVKEDNSIFYTCVISYDKELQQMVQNYFKDIPDYNELTLRYYPQVENFGLYFGKYNAEEDVNGTGFDAHLSKSEYQYVKE